MIRPPMMSFNFQFPLGCSDGCYDSPSRLSNGAPARLLMPPRNTELS